VPRTRRLADAAPNMADHHRIDVHSHVVPPFWAEQLESYGRDQSGTVVTGWWSPQRAIALMDSQHIATSVLSLTAPSVVGWPDDRRPDMARRVNEYTADLVTERPDRFGMFATLPLPDVDATLGAIEYAFDTLSADGVTMLSNIRGRYAGEPYLEPVWAELDRRHAVVFLHPAQPQLPLASGEAAPLIDYPFDTTRAAVQMVLNGVTTRYPNLKVILVHAGGFLPYVAYRVAELNRVFDPHSLAPREILDQCRRFHVDTALSSSPAALPTLTAFVPQDRILFGSDNPYAPPEATSLFARHLDEAPFTAEQSAAINRGNALALLPRLAARSCART
jgi:aminocarboxymuconate-semialdehyde decarboxylase